MRAASTIGPPVGRVLLSLIFLMSGIHKLMDWDGTHESMHKEGMVAVDEFLAAAVACELLGGLSVLLGLWSRVGALLLIVFLIPTTAIFHDFWQYAGAEQQQQMIHFMKNLAILGGLFIVLGLGSGCCSLDGSGRKA